VQTETLRQEYLKQFKKKEEFKTELVDVKKKNLRVENKIIETEVAIEEMLDLLEGDKDSQKEKINKHTLLVNPKMRKKMLE